MIRPTSAFYRQNSALRSLGALLILLSALALSAGCSDDEDEHQWDIEDQDVGGEPDAGETEPDAADPAPPEPDARDQEPSVVPVPVSVETVLSPSTASAGSSVQVTCRLLSADGEEVAPPDDASPRVVLAPAQSFLPPEDLTLVPIVAGHASVACQYPSLSLVDDSAAELEIRPGAPYTVTTELDKNIISAGGEASATCEVFDAYQNKIHDADTSLRVDSSGSDIQIDDHTVKITRAGLHQVNCSVDGAQEEYGEYLEVNPGLPAQLAASKVPDRPYYGTGQVVEVATIVADEHGNTIDDAPVSVVQQNAGGEDNTFGHGRFRFQEDGTYTVLATVEPPTHRDRALAESVEIKVSGQGPSIECVSPSNGSMRDLTPESLITFRGRVQDAHGVGEVTVNGQPVSVDSSGLFEHEISTRFGLNFVDIVASDSLDPEFSNENSTTCAFLVADKWESEKGSMSDAVALWLSQSAVDDGNASGPINSLNDVLHRALNSDGLRDQIDTALSSQNPLADDCYRIAVCINYKLFYRESKLEGPNTTTLRLTNGGLKLSALLKNIELKMRLESLINANFTVSVSELNGELETSLTLRNGRPTVSLIPNTVSVTADDPEFSIDSLPGWLNSIINTILKGTVKRTVENQVEDFLKNQLQEVLDSMISGLDISALGSTFDVPRLDGQGSVALDFGVTFSSLAVSTTRALFGLGTKFTASPATRATPSLGVAMPSGQNLLTTNPGTPIAAGVHIGALNHVLHALWRAGLFDADIASSAIGASFPEGTEITMSTGLPPVAALNGPTKAELSMGDVRMSIVYPGLFDDPVELQLGVRAESNIAIDQSGDDPSLDFSDVQIKELFFSPVGISLDNHSRSVLENFLSGVLQNLINTSLNSALPALPIPSFELPTTLNAYGLPGGSSLGILNPALGGGDRHLQIKGTFGVLP